MERLDFENAISRRLEIAPGTVRVVQRELYRAGVLEKPARGRHHVHLSAHDLLAITIGVASNFHYSCADPVNTALWLVPEEYVRRVQIGETPIVESSAPEPEAAVRAIAALRGDRLAESLVNLVDHLAHASRAERKEIEATPPTVTLTFNPEMAAEICVPLAPDREWRRRFVRVRPARRRKRAELLRQQAVLTYEMMEFLADCWRDTLAHEAPSDSSTSGGNGAAGKRSAATPARAAAQSADIPATIGTGVNQSRDSDRINPILAPVQKQGFPPAPSQRSLFGEPFIP